MAGPITSYLLSHGVSPHLAQRVLQQIRSQVGSGRPTPTVLQLLQVIKKVTPGAPGAHIGKNKLNQRAAHGFSVPGSNRLEETPEEEEMLQGLPNPVENQGRMPNPDDIMGRRGMPRPEEVMRRGGNRAMPNPDEVMSPQQVQALANKIMAGR